MKVSERTRPWWLLPPVRLHPAWWFAMAVPLLWIEYVAGLYNQFPVIYVIPVSLAAWYSGRRPALMLAIAIPLIHLLFMAFGTTPGNLVTVLVTTVIRGPVIVFMALWFARLSEHERALQSEVQMLRGLLPICSFCKSIRNEAGEWERLERFISGRSETKFSHGVCPSCQAIHYP